MERVVLNWRPFFVRRMLIVSILSSLATLGCGHQLAAAKSAESELRLSVDDSRVLPGDVVEVSVHGAGMNRLIGGPDSYLEERTDGGWRPLYVLHWVGVDEPSIRGPNDDVEFVRVGTRIAAVVPPVEPGKYRIARPFRMEGSAKRLKLTKEINVEPCSMGTTPQFIPGSALGDDLGTPACR